MAILTKIKLNPQQRLDLEDWNAAIGAIETDWKFWTQQFLAPGQFILKGFEVTGLGAPAPVTVSLTDATLINASNSDCFSWFTAEMAATPLSANLLPGQRNYLELELSTEDGTPLTRAFWDPAGNSGEGVEFNQTVDTVTDIRIDVISNTSSFTGNANRIPLAIVDTDGGNVVKTILDKRPMFFRLGQPGDVEKNFNWISQEEPSVTLNLTGVSGTFIPGETLNFSSGASAELLSGTSTPLQAIKFTSDSFEPGDTVTGTTSAASGTLDTASESFSGADKNIKNFKDMLDALMTEIKRIKGTDFWFEDITQSVFGAIGFLNSILMPDPSASNPVIGWTGTHVSITDENMAPSANDVLANARFFGSAQNFSLTRQDGQDGSSLIPVADGEVLYIELPAAGNRTFDEPGAGDTNYRTISRAAFVPNDRNYWLAYREGTRLMLRGKHELEPDEEVQIGDQVTQDLLTALGLPENNPNPNYGSNIRGVSGESFLSRISTLTHNQGDSQEDRSGFLRSDSIVIWDGNDLSFSDDIEIRIPNTKTGTYATYTIQTAQSPISLANNEIAYVTLDRTTPGNVTVQIAASLPAQTQATKDIIVLFQRIDSSAGNFLHIPFHKQVLRQGQAVFLGASGSGSGVVKADLHDPLSNVLPSGATATVDGISIVNGDLVLFSNLNTNNNRVYQASGVGSSITWTPQFSFETGQDPDDGDLIIIQRGEAFADQIGKFTGSDWEFNKTVRYFDGADYVEFESLKTVTLDDNTTNGVVFSVNAAASNNWIIHASLERAGEKEIVTLHLTHDGTDVSIAQYGTDIAGNVGVNFHGQINAGDLELLYDTTSTGDDTSMKFFFFRWSDSAGGPGGVPSYSGASSTGVVAAGNTGDIQFKGPGGGLAANSNFNWNNSGQYLEMGDTEITVSQAAITLLDNQSNEELISYNASTYKYVIIEYGIERDGNYRVGRLMIANNGTQIGFSDDSSPDMGSGVGVTLGAVISGSNVEIQYSTDNRTEDGTFEILQIRRK